MLNLATIGSRRGMTPALVILAYLCLEWISYLNPLAPLGAAPWKLASGLGFFLLLRYGLGFLGPLLAACLAEILILHWADIQVIDAAPGVAILCYAFAASLLRRRIEVQQPLNSARDVAWMLGVVVPATLLASLVVVVIQALVTGFNSSSAAYLILRNWTAELIGIMFVTPLLMSLGGARGWRATRSGIHKLEIVGQALAIGAALWAAFVLPDVVKFRPFSVLLLPMTWIAARWGLQGTAYGLAAVQIGVIISMQMVSKDASFLASLQFFMITLGVTGLVLGTAVTERRNAEAMLREKSEALNQAQRFAVAGELTSALAHELNQPIAALLAFSGSCQALIRPPSMDRPMLEDIVGKLADEARRAALVMRRLRNYYRDESKQQELVTSQDVIHGVLHSVEGRIKQLRAEVTIDGQKATLFVDRVQIECALQNLINNALDSVATKEGRRSIAVDVDVDMNARRVLISVQDNGNGVTPEICGRLFQPFTTTKPQGMGMGLAISKSLVATNGGELSYKSDYKQGACFVMTLPMVDEPR